MSDATLNEEIARLEIEIDAVRDELDEAIKRNEGLEEELERLRGFKAVHDEIMEMCGKHGCPAGEIFPQWIDRQLAALATARTALETISDNGGDTITIEDAVRIVDAALEEQKP